MGFFYLLLVAGVAYFAKLRGRSPLAWAVIALLISPLLSGILLLFLKNLSTDGYRGDTIDTTAKPVPANEPTSPKRTYQGGAAKNHEDVDSAISRMEEKLSKDKTAGNVSASAKASASLGAVSVLTSEDNPARETAEPNNSQDVVNDLNLTSQDVSSLESDSTKDISNHEVVAELEAEVVSADLVEPSSAVEPCDLQQTSSQTAGPSNLAPPVMAEAVGREVLLEKNVSPQDNQVCSQQVSL